MDREFWNALAKKKKTTGYSDYFIASFDQFMRLKIVEKFLDQYAPLESRKTALDFGCGIGDFSFMLSRYFNKVYGYDIADEILEYAKKADNISYITELVQK